MENYIKYECSKHIKLIQIHFDMQYFVPCNQHSLPLRNCIHAVNISFLSLHSCMTFSTDCDCFFKFPRHRPIILHRREAMGAGRSSPRRLRSSKHFLNVRGGQGLGSFRCIITSVRCIYLVFMLILARPRAANKTLTISGVAQNTPNCHGCNCKGAIVVHNRRASPRPTGHCHMFCVATVRCNTVDEVM
jgi:hypothetical protein